MQFLLFLNRIINLWIPERIFLRPALKNSAGIWSVPGNALLISFSIAFLSSKHSSQSLVALRPNITNLMYIQKLRQMVPPNNQNTVAVCNQITLLILYYINSRLVILLKNTDALTQVSDILGLTVSFKVINLTFRYSFFFLKFQLPSRLTLFRLPTVIWVGYCKHCILSCFFDL